eukprot:SAG11_NODE_28730_length_318_cov_1.182648_1_plen_45_part_10
MGSLFVASRSDELGDGGKRRQSVEASMCASFARPSKCEKILARVL